MQMTKGTEYQGMLHVGQIVHSIVGGGHDGYIKQIDGEQRPDTIMSLSSGGAFVTGGNAQVRVRFETGYETVVPEAVVRSVQWCIGPEPLNDEIKASNIIEAAEIDVAYEAAVKQREADKEAKLKADAELSENLPKQYPYLETVADFEKRTGKQYGSRLCAAQNIRRELAKAFPGHKFSVTSEIFSGGDSIDVRWVDGPNSKQVKRIIAKYNDHVTDETGDYRDPTNEVFNKLYGGAKYVMEARSMSKETEAALIPWADEQFKADTIWAKDSCGRENLVWQLVAAYSIPAGMKVVGVKPLPDRVVGQHVSDFYTLVLEEKV